MRALLIGVNPEFTAAVSATLKKKNRVEVVHAPGVEHAIGLFEEAGKKANFDIVVCDLDQGGALALFECLVGNCAGTPCILMADSEKDISSLGLPTGETLIEVVERSEGVAGVNRVLQRLCEGAVFRERKTPDDDFIAFDPERFELTKPLMVDIYIRLRADRYCKRFKKGDEYDSAELQDYFQQKGLARFYIHKLDELELLKEQARRLEALANEANPDSEQIERTVGETLAIVHDVVSRIGFTEKVQEATRKTVSLTLKAIGSTPRLNEVLGKLRLHEGKYITSHSMMLAELACAVAYKCGLASGPVFTKLTLAAFLHDLPLKDNRLARYKSLREVEDALQGLVTEISDFRMHPVRAAEYARKFDDIPPDVDTILLQHHELPDGSGFPRSIRTPQFLPASCVFIVAHELLHFFLDTVPANDRASMLPAFCRECETKYKEGHFRKIMKGLAKETDD